MSNTMQYCSEIRNTFDYLVGKPQGKGQFILLFITYLPAWYYPCKFTGINYFCIEE